MVLRPRARPVVSVVRDLKSILTLRMRRGEASSWIHSAEGALHSLTTAPDIQEVGTES